MLQLDFNFSYIYNRPKFYTSLNVERQDIEFKDTGTLK